MTTTTPLYCGLCASKRPNIRAWPCLHIFHTRCLFPFEESVQQCLICNANITSLEILPPSPFEYASKVYEIAHIMKVFGINR